MKKYIITENQFNNLLVENNNIDEIVINAIKVKNDIQNYSFRKTDNIQEMSDIKTLKVKDICKICG